MQEKRKKSDEQDSVELKTLLEQPKRKEKPRFASVAIQKDSVEDHVGAALLAARDLASEDRIDAATALQGILAVKDDFRSSAFNNLAALLKLDPEPFRAHVKYKTLPSGPTTFKFSPALERSYRNVAEHDERSSRIWGRDWITVVLLTAGEKSLDALAQEAGTTLHDLRNAWFEFVMETKRPNAKQRFEALWRKAGVPLPGERIANAGYVTESDTDTDHLDIENEAWAISRLILDQDVVPPLSIGLLGDWGSGKSTFINLITSKIRSGERTEGQHEKVAIVEFNAWHYSDTNLWASLVSHIFDRIWHEIDKGDNQELSRDEIFAEIARTNGVIKKASSKLAAAREDLAQAESRLQKNRKVLAIQSAASETIRDQLDSVIETLGWKTQIEDIVQVERAIKELHQAGTRTHMMIDQATRGRVLASALPWITAAIAAGLGVAFIGTNTEIEWFKPIAEEIGALLGIAGGVASAVIAPLTKASKHLNDYSDRLDVARKAALERDEQDKDSDDPAQKARYEQTLQARREYESAEKALSSAEQRLAELQLLYAEKDPERQMRTFLSSVVESEKYNSQRGIISLVHEDFKKLSELMTPPKPQAGKPVPIDRIVLVIDDLDRCSPENVVQVLEAIHLLLALELFIVIVAVDSRWLLRSLEVQYKELLGTSQLDTSSFRRSTPQNYLEKIFQITYALAPMSKKGFDRYVDHLSTTKQTPHVATSDDKGPAGPGGTPVAGKIVPPSPPPPPINTTSPRPLVITPAEREFIHALHPIIPTPRLTKRLVNVYRLIKSTTPTDVLPDDDARSQGQHRPLLLLLALLLKNPTHASALFRGLYEQTRPFDDGARPLNEAVKKLSPNRQLDLQPLPTDLTHLSQDIASIAADITVKDCSEWAGVVARYSLVTGQEWHTWRRGRPG